MHIRQVTLYYFLHYTSIDLCYVHEYNLYDIRELLQLYFDIVRTL